MYEVDRIIVSIQDSITNPSLKWFLDIIISSLIIDVVT